MLQQLFLKASKSKFSKALAIDVIKACYTLPYTDKT